MNIFGSSENVYLRKDRNFINQYRLLRLHGHLKRIHFIFCVFINLSDSVRKRNGKAKLFAFLFINSLRIVIMQWNWGRIKQSSPWWALLDKISMKETVL